MACMTVCAAEVALPPAAKLPASVDLRPEFRRFHLAAQNQGARGTCSIFAIAGVLEYEYALSGVKHSKLSAEYLNWASHQTNGRASDGSFFADALNGLRTYGICRAALWPYAATFDSTLLPGPRAHADAATRRDITGRWIKHWNVRTGMTERMLRLLKQSLAQGHPVAIGLRWPKTEVWLEDDCLAVPAPAEVFDGHSIILVGYEDNLTLPGGGHFIFRNHAGPRWRQQGHAHLPYAYVQAYGNNALGLRVGQHPSKEASLCPSS